MRRTSGVLEDAVGPVNAQKSADVLQMQQEDTNCFFFIVEVMPVLLCKNQVQIERVSLSSMVLCRRGDV